MAIITKKRGRKPYQVRVRDHQGKWYPATSFKRKVDAEKHERELMAARDQGASALSREQRSLTVKELFDAWHKGRLGKVSNGWHATIRQMADDHIMPIIGSIKVCDVKPPHIGEVMTQLTMGGRKAQTRLHVYQVMRQLFDAAVNYFNLIPSSPVLKCDRPKVRRKEPTFLTPEDSWRLLAAAKSHYLGAAIWLGLLAGLRTSEIQALRWDSIDLENREILIRSAYKRRSKVIEDFPKGGDHGRVAIPEALRAYLVDLKRDKKPSDFVAAGARGGMLEQKKLHNGLATLCKAAGVPVISPHGLRHSCTEIWISSKASVEDLRRQLNQKSTSTTMRYIHRTDDRVKGIASTILPPKPDLKIVNH